MLFADTAYRLSYAFSAFHSPIEALCTVLRDTKNRRMRRTLDICIKGVSAGYSLSDSLEMSRGAPDIFTQSVRAGEESGKLSESFYNLASYYERLDSLKKRISAGMRYPLFVVILAAAVIWTVGRVASPALTSLNIESAVLPENVGLFINISQTISAFLRYFILSLVLILLLFTLLRSTRAAELFFTYSERYFPSVFKISKLWSTWRFAEAAAILLSSGVSLPDAVRCGGKSAGGVAGRNAELVASAIEAGYSFGDALRESGAFPDSFCSFVSVGEDTGALIGALRDAGELYRSEALCAAERAAATLAPALTVLVGLITAFTVASVYLPILAIYGAVEF